MTQILKRTMATAFLVAFVCIVSFSQTIVLRPDTIGREAAFGYALKNTLDGQINPEYDYYISKSQVQDPMINGKLYKGLFWIVFVDMAPEANWEHPCKYVYIKKGTTSTDYTAIPMNASLPPRGVKFVPRILTKKTKSRMSGKTAGPLVLPYEKSDTGSSVSAGSHTYAVILSGGSTPEYNVSRYWNDCSYIYKTLTQTYRVPKQNVRVLMSDGLSPQKDKNNNLTLFPDLVSSSPDLDGDGQPEIDYSATKDTLKMVLSELKAKLTDEDHLLVFVTDHGGKDPRTGVSYINLWNSERIYPTEFANCFNGFNAGYISFVLGQCYSGGFIPALKADNHIVMTACAKDEKSYRCSSVDLDYNEFLYNWTSYINGRDTFGNTVPSNSSGGITINFNKKTLKKAYEYAVKADSYNKGKTLSNIENPQISILSRSTAEDLALDTIPPTVDLCITDYHHLRPQLASFPWASSYLWIRNQNDGVENQKTENPYINEEHPYIYVYTKVCNRGVKPYSGGWEKLSYCWTKSSMVITADMWKGMVTYEYSSDDVFGGTMDSPVTLSEYINPGDTIVKEKKYTFTDDYYVKVTQSDKLSLCVLAYLSNKSYNYKFPLTEEGFADIKNSSKLAQNNTVSPFVVPNSVFWEKVSFVNPFEEEKDYCIRLNKTSSSSRLLSKAEVNIKFPSSSVSSFEESQNEADSVRMDINARGKMRLLGASSIIREVKMRPQEAVPVYLTCNFKADVDNNISETYDLDFVVVDNRTGKEVGGQRFRIKGNERPAIDATLDKCQVDLGHETLSVVDCSEDVQYEWFDKDGKLVGTGSSITVPAGTDTSEYTVRITAKSDGAVIYRKAEVGGTQIIDTVTPSADYVKVSLKEKSNGPLSLQLSSTTSSMPVQSCDIAPGSTSCTMHVQNFSNGVYQMSLLKDGKVIDTRKFIK